ncbi:protein-like protein STU1 [Xylogone sp. PMI_703]|nr:protein-like protein STU1 [Xylogone sp. PMI_703]
MGEKVTEEQVANLLTVLRTDASNDAKVNLINAVKSSIKQNNVPEPCIAPLFDAARTSMTSQHASIASAGFSTLNHLLTRLLRQDPAKIMKECGRTLPLVVEKMGDQKEKYRQLAAQCLTSFWRVSPQDVERIVKNSGLVGKNSRQKEACLNWLVQMHEEWGLAFKVFVPTLMELLEDADGMVRDTAKQSVVKLFKNAPGAALSDLKKQLKVSNVRPAIVTAITSQLGPGVPVEVESAPEPAEAAPSGAPAPPEAKSEKVEPAYVNTQRELDETFKEMLQYFEGKESEQNWLKREQSCTKIRRLNAGNAPSDFHDTYVAGIKSLTDGILKAVNSLRTSLCKEGCSVIQEVAKTLGSSLDPMVEILLQNLIKLCAGTKKISSQLGNGTVDIIISKVSYTPRILQHIWMACQDKNVQPRTYASGWLKTLLKKEAHHKSHLEHGGGLDTIQNCIKKGLTDANPGVRESMRGTYWTFALIWPQKATGIMAGLEAAQQRLLEMDPNNPNSPKKTQPSARPGQNFSKSVSGPPKPSLRETMMAQKKAAMAQKTTGQPPRPGSAMSTFTPVGTPASGSKTPTTSTAPDAAHQRSRPDAGHGGLSVAPMRPAKFKPPVRPATAGPYSVRKAGNAPSESLASSPPGSTIVKSKTSSTNPTPHKRLPVRPNTSHSNHSNQSGQTSPTRSTAGRSATSPRVTPARPKSAMNPIESSPSKGDEEFTMVVPNLSVMNGSHLSIPPPTSSPKSEAVTPSKSLKVYEDPFSNTDDQITPRPTFNAPVLGEVPVNEEALNRVPNESTNGELLSPTALKQNARLLDSGIAKVNTKSLDVHGFRKLQGMIRDNKTTLTEEKAHTLLLGLFDYLEAPLLTLTPEKIQDVKAQILATIKLMFKKQPDVFKAHVQRGLECILGTRRGYDSRAHIVSGLEVLADELVTLSDPSIIAGSIIERLNSEEMTLEGCRVLSMGLHILRELLEVKKDFMPSSDELSNVSKLAAKCLESSESGVRMDAVQLCVAIHSRVGEAKFWGALTGVKDDPKSLITYYIVKRQREVANSA